MRIARVGQVGEDPRACPARGERNYKRTNGQHRTYTAADRRLTKLVKLNREVDGHADIFATILARKSARKSVSVSLSVSVSVPWNLSLTLVVSQCERQHGDSDDDDEVLRRRLILSEMLHALSAAVSCQRRVVAVMSRRRR